MARVNTQAKNPTGAETTKSAKKSASAKITAPARNPASAKKVYVGMSGGVDSSVAAMLLKRQGYDVTGIYMKNWSKDLPGMKCPWAEDLADAKRVAVRLGIPFEVWDFEATYRERVVESMLSDFKKGRTPNPDVICNQEIKFKLFYEKARENGADLIATGHYAQIVPGGENTSRDLASAVNENRDLTSAVNENRDLTHAANKNNELARAADENKDQTYFLYRISDEAINHTLFPLGHMKKPEVKKLAAENGLHNAYKKESMGVCFVGEVGMRDFLKEYIQAEPGEIREAGTQKVLGMHEGAVFYTLGQRHGLYLSGVAGEVDRGLPYYVVGKDLAKNIVYVSKNLNFPTLWTDELSLNNVVWRGELKETRFLVRLRHRGELIPADFDGEKVKFTHKIKRPAAGQSAVIYEDQICRGGGFIA